jgi:hypothetical protein
VRADTMDYITENFPTTCRPRIGKLLLAWLNHDTAKS